MSNKSGKKCTAAGRERTRAFTQQVVIPTYTLGKGHPAAAIFELEETRGAYPRTVYDITSRGLGPVEREYEMSVLENEFLRVEVLAEVGGRVWRIVDKTSGRNLLWTNEVIKPVDVGRRHGWIEGSIEFPFPVSNHGEDTLEPYRSALRENEDGSATVTVSSFDHFYRFWSSYDITLRPSEHRMAITARLYNPTPVRNRYQIWINGAVPASDDMQFIFPVDYIAGHGFSGVHPWPMWNDGAYDRSFWKNQQDMLGVFGWGADFLGVYYHDDDCGTIRCCPHEQAEGIKAWTWGTSSRWTSEYADEQEPCVEIQWGRWPTQTMYGWLEPHQMDSWTEYWCPVSGLGGVDHASADAAMSLKVDGSTARVAMNVFCPVKGRLKVSAGGREILSKAVDAAPGTLIEATVEIARLGAGDRLEVTLTDESGATVISYDRPVEPSPAVRPEEPVSIRVDGEGPDWDEYEAALSAELLSGDQDRARSGYEDILKRKPDFAPALKALGILLYKQGETEPALDALQKASALDTVDEECAYYLTLAALDCGRKDVVERFENYGGGRFAHLSAFARGLAALRRGEFEEAGRILSGAAETLGTDPVAWDHVAAARRLSGDLDGARAALEKALAAEPMDPFAHVERLTAAGTASADEIRKALGADADLYVETAFFYDAAGDPDTALAVALAGEKLAGSALYHYHISWFAERAGKNEQARQAAAKADSMGADYVFPHRLEDKAVLEAAGRLSGGEGLAKYHLGTLTYWLGRGRDALALWEGMLGKCDIAGLYHKVADAHSKGRLSRAYESAIDMYRRAREEDPEDIEVYYSLDDLYEKSGDVQNRRALLAAGRELFADDDELAVRMARYNSRFGHPEKAMVIIESHAFQRRHQSWRLMKMARETVETTYCGLAVQSMREGRERQALALIEKAAKAQEIVREWFD